MATREEDARQRRLERKHLLQKQAAINEQLLAILDDEEQAEDGLPSLSTSAPKRSHPVQDDGAKQKVSCGPSSFTAHRLTRRQQTNHGFATLSSHRPPNYTFQNSAPHSRRDNADTTNEVTFLSTSSRPSSQPAAEPRKRKKRPSNSLDVLGSDSEDDRPLLSMRRKERKSRVPKTETNVKVKDTSTFQAAAYTAPPAFTGPAFTASASTAPASTAPDSKGKRRGLSDKYKLFHPTPDNKYDMILMVGDQVVELACCFCGGNHFKSGPSWKALVGVHGLAKHIQLSHKDEAIEAVGRGAFDWVMRNCIRKILLRSEIAEVLAGTYFVEEIHVRTQTH